MNRKAYSAILSTIACVALGFLCGCGSSSSSSTPPPPLPPPVTTNYVFYVSGQEAPNTANLELVSFYALAGTVSIDTSGNVVTGEQDYNDAFGITASDSIMPGASALVVDHTTGQGMLTLKTNDPNVGVNGVETFGVQFVNTRHALIMQFDGSATSSGSLDLQTATTVQNGGYAFTLSGVDSASYFSVAYGGVFTVTGTSVSGFADVNDSDTTGIVSLDNPFSATVTPSDALGRGSVTGVTIAGTPLSINYYVVGPEVIRIIDVDTTDSAVGSAFGQGAGAFSNASLGASVLGLAGNAFSSQFGALGQFTTSNTSTDPADFAGVGEASEVGDSFSSALAAPISGTYSIASDGYGSLTVTSGNWGDFSALGVYMTDPNLNLERSQ